MLIVPFERRRGSVPSLPQHGAQFGQRMCILVNQPSSPGIAEAIVGDKLQQCRFPLIVAAVEAVVCRCGFDFAAVPAAETGDEAQIAVAERQHGLAMHAVVHATPGRK